MTGVEILAVKEVATDCIYNWTAFWIVFILIFSLFVSAGVFLDHGTNRYGNIIFGVCIGLLFGFMFGGVSGVIFGTDTAYKNEYKVVISDEVSMNEFLEKYEIIDQEGKIYTVMERE